MLLRIHKDIHFETKVPQEVFTWIFQFLRSNSRDLNSIKVKINLFSLKPDFLPHLAQFVPADELCFKIDYKAYKKTELAERMIYPATSYAFECELTKYLSGEETLRFIERDVLGMKPGILRSLGFMFDVHNIMLLGLREEDTVSIHLMDYKGLQCKKRFACLINLTLEIGDEKDKETKAILDVLSRQTGVDFTNCNVAHSFPEKYTDQLDVQQILAVHVRFQEAVEETTRDMEKAIPDWTLVPGLKRQDSVLDDRIESIREGKTGRVNFNSIVKKFYKTALPSIAFESNEGDLLWFSKRYSDQVKILVGIQKIHVWGLGKTFTLQIGFQIQVSEKTKPQLLHVNIGRFLHERYELCWTYGSEDELLEVLHTSTQVLKKILMSWEQRITKYFDFVPDHIPDILARRDGFTMKAAYEEADPIAKRISPDSELCGVYSGCNLTIRELDGGAGVDEHGKLKSHGDWGFYYQSEAHDLLFGVIIPAIGSSYYIFRGPLGEYRENAIANLSELLDSDEAMAIMQEHLGDVIRQNPITFWDGLMRLGTDGPPETWFVDNRNQFEEGTPIWSVHFLGSSERGRQDVHIALDAVTGKNVVCFME